MLKRESWTRNNIHAKVGVDKVVFCNLNDFSQIYDSCPSSGLREGWELLSVKVALDEGHQNQFNQENLGAKWWNPSQSDKLTFFFPKMLSSDSGREHSDWGCAFRTRGWDKFKCPKLISLLPDNRRTFLRTKTFVGLILVFNLTMITKQTSLLKSYLEFSRECILVVCWQV